MTSYITKHSSCMFTHVVENEMLIICWGKSKHGRVILKKPRVLRVNGRRRSSSHDSCLLLESPSASAGQTFPLCCRNRNRNKFLKKCWKFWFHSKIPQFGQGERKCFGNGFSLTALTECDNSQWWASSSQA